MSLSIEQGGWTNSTEVSEDGSSNGSVSQFKDLVEGVFRGHAKGHKVSLLITSAFSLAAALIVIIVVIADARTLQQRISSTRERTRPGLWASVHKAEVMPFAIAVVSAIQSCIFLGVQSQSLDLLWTSGCTLTAQLIWPAIWAVAITVSAFSLESTFRSLQVIRYEAHGKLHLFASVIMIVLFLLATFITAHVLPSDNICWGSLIWWAIHFVQASIALGAGIILVNLITGVVLVIQLLKTSNMCRDERIAASRVIYSLGINVVILALVLPFFICYALGDLNRDASMMADSAVTLNGLLHGFLHLFLRSNSELSAIQSRDASSIKRRPLRLFGFNDLNVYESISSPIVTELDTERTRLWANVDKKDFLDHNLECLPRQQFISIHPDVPPPLFSSSSTPKKFPGLTYSIFPSDKASISRSNQTPLAESASRSDSPPTYEFDSKSRQQVDSMLTIFSTDSDAPEDSLKPPQPLFLGRKRCDSETTSAIVEIALRLSKAPSDADSVYIHEPIAPIEPVKLARGPSLLSPDRYVPAARLAEAAKSRPGSPGESKQTVHLVELPKSMVAQRVVGLPGSPSESRKKLHHNVRSTIAAKIISRRSQTTKPSLKKLPAVPDREQPQEIAALKALIQTSRPPAIAPAQQAKLPIPDWRQPIQQTVVAKEVKSSDESRTRGERAESSPRDGWL